MSSYKYYNSLLNTFGDSFYVLKKSEFIQNIEEFVNAFKNHYRNTQLGYSVKTNYIPYICKVAYQNGIYIEIVSEMELLIAQKLGIPTEKIIYNGPIKGKKSLEYCLNGNSKVNVDNFDELTTIVQIAKDNPEKEFKIGMRINVQLNDNFFSRFGFDAKSDEFISAIKLIKQTPNLKITGLHTHSTRPDKSIESYLKRLEKVFEVYSSGIFEGSLEYLDLGGGFFGKMDENIRQQFGLESVVSFEEYGEAIGKRMKAYFPDEKPELILEPGLALTVNILDFVCKVVNVRNIGTKKIATVTASIHNIKPSGHKKNLSVKHFSPQQPNIPGNTDIVGYTCLENDIINTEFPYLLRKDDILKFENIGAYTIVFKPVFIKLGPPVIMISEDGDIKKIKEEDKFSDYFNCYKFD